MLKNPLKISGSRLLSGSPPYIAMLKNPLKISGSRLLSGSPPKFNRFFLIPFPIFPGNFIKICPYVFELCC